MSQQQVQKSRVGKADRTEEVPVEPVREHPESDALTAHSDSLLDEIDGLLEENAQEFIDAFVQKGGQ